MGFPGADLLHFSYRGLRRTTLDQTPHFRIYQAFCRDPESYLRDELARIVEERRQLHEADSEDYLKRAEERDY